MKKVGENKWTDTPFAWPDYKDRLLAVAEEASRTGHCVYVAWCLFDQPIRKNESARVVPGVPFDIDLASGKHAASNYPETEEEALRLFSKSGLKLTRLARTGGGLCGHLLFDKPVVIVSDQDRAEIAALLKGVTNQVRAGYEEEGKKLDDISDLARAIRLLGSIGWKYGQDCIITMVETGGPRYKVEDLEAYAGAGVLRSELARMSQLKQEDVSESDEPGRGSFAQIERYCAFIRDLKENSATVEEPRWYAAATIAAHCSDGEERFHAISALDRTRYSESETALKLRHASRVLPRTCDNIDRQLGFEGCQRCPFRASRIRSPYALGFGDPELLKLQAEYVLAPNTDMYHCVVRNEPDMPAKSFDKEFADRVTGPDKSFALSKRSPKVKAIDYIPGEQRLIVEEEEGVKILNTWRVGGVEPAEGSCNLILEHLDYTFPITPELDWYLDYKAHLLQKPHIKIKHGIIPSP